MPNHVTHRVLVTGPADDLKKFREGYIVSEEEEDFEGKPTGATVECLDFNRVIPMPESLEETTSGSFGAIGYDAFHGTDGEWKRIVDYPWVKEKGITTQKQLHEFLDKKSPEYRRQGDLAKRNIEQYGFCDWYEWAVEHWNTKWPAYRHKWIYEGCDRLDFTFCTAWSPPTPIFEELSRLFPTIRFFVRSFDEGYNFACQGSFENGENDYVDVPANDEMYEAVYGEKPMRDEE